MRRPRRPLTARGSAATLELRAAAGPSPGTLLRRSRSRAARVSEPPRRARGRQVPGTPGVPPPAPVGQTRRPSRAALKGPSGQRPARVVPARLVTAAGDFRGATTTPARPATGLVTGGRPSRAAAPLPPVTTARIAAGARTAPTPIPGTAAPGRQPVREMVAAIWPPAMTVPSGLTTAAKATGHRCWGPGHRPGNGGYPTAGASWVAGQRPARWDVGYDNDGGATAPLELGVTGPVVTSIQRRPDVARYQWLSASWMPPTPVTATGWRDSLTSRQVVALFRYDPSINWAATGPREVTAAMVEYARIGLAYVVPSSAWSLRVRDRSGFTPLCGASCAQRAAPSTLGSIVATTDGIALAL